jgi:hypothetical protein
MASLETFSLEQKALIMASHPSFREINEAVGVREEEIRETEMDPSEVYRIKLGDPNLLNLLLQNVGGKRHVLGFDDKYAIRFLFFHRENPVEANRRINRAISAIPQSEQRHLHIDRYVNACLDLETTADRLNHPNKDFERIPSYLMNGFVLEFDKKKYEVDKQKLRQDLARAKKWAIRHEGSELELVKQLYQYVHDMKKDDAQSAIMMQLMLQESGINSSVVRGVYKGKVDTDLFPMTVSIEHLWNMVELGQEKYVVDVGRPFSNKKPFIVMQHHTPKCNRNYQR